MGEFWGIYLGGLAVLLGCMAVLWVVSVLLRDASIVDPFWGMTFVISGWYYYAQAEGGDPARKVLVVALVTIWGVRLSIYLLWRNWGKGEDFRYQGFRQKYGPDRYWWFSFFQVFMFQGLLSWLISAPLLGAQIRGEGLGVLDYLAVGVWIVGFVFEAGGDWQLARFKRNPANKGKLLTSGFWRYTRHPNYFGDSAVWWGYGLLSVAAGSYVAALGAVFMTWVIIWVSGVFRLEKALVEEKPGYEEYVRRTSVFLPLPRKTINNQQSTVN